MGLIITILQQSCVKYPQVFQIHPYGGRIITPGLLNLCRGHLGTLTCSKCAKLYGTVTVQSAGMAYYTFIVQNMAGGQTSP
jgi:hypothetical protein